LGSEPAGPGTCQVPCQRRYAVHQATSPLVCATRRDSPAGAAHRLRLHSPIFDRAGWRSESECHVRTQRPRGRPSATTPVRRLERDRTERCHDLIRTKRCSPCQRHASGLTSGEYIDPRGSGHKLSDPTAHDRLECCGWRITCAHLLPVSPSSSHRRVRAGRKPWTQFTPGGPTPLPPAATSCPRHPFHVHISTRPIVV
jgi:hypothetical protein